MIVIRRLLITVAAFALLGGVTACSALVGPDRQESIDAGIDERIEYLETVFGAAKAEAFDVPPQFESNGLMYTNDAGLGEYRVTFDSCSAPAAIMYGKVDDDGVVIERTGWFGRVPGEDEVYYNISATDNSASLSAALCSQL